MTTSSAVACRRQALVLNADFRPLSTWPLSLVSAKDAVKAVFSGEVMVLEEWDEVFRSPSTEIRIPKILALRNYAPISAAPKFCRRSILLRDRYRCQYCGNRFAAEELTFDHVIPRSAGGQTTWDNILTACVDCNTRKKHHLPNWSGQKGKGAGEGMRPLKVPRQPSTAELLRAGLEFLDDNLKHDYGSWLYHNVELLP